MNYRHAFHAGNFADVVKHAVLARILAHLTAKPAAFRVIDTHAGAGVYDLSSEEATRTGEWQGGIGRLRAASLDEKVAALLAPYLDAVAALNPHGRLSVYPGSPALVAALMREQDRLVACELEPKAAAALKANFRRDTRVSTVAIDGYMALNAYVPPKERRGLVLIDPPFEAADEFARLTAALSAAHRKWPSGLYVIWYPVKSQRDADAFARRVAGLGIPKILRAEVTAGAGGEPGRLRGSGLMIVNPPWTLEAELGLLLPALAGILAHDGRGRAAVERLTAEK
jgi:23S rRNA (adenine2030-N6)-methyltransferase